MARYLTLFLALALLPGCDLFSRSGACKVDADCDDDNACTVDACNVRTGVCTNNPRECPAGQECDPDTGL